MIAASHPIQRPADARLLSIDGQGEFRHLTRRSFVDLFEPGDLLVANDAATLPASLKGRHLRTGAAIEVRLAGRRSLAAGEARHFAAVVFGEGDFRTRTEDRLLPPGLVPGDRLALGTLSATVDARLGHPRLIALSFHGTLDQVWEGLSRHGRPIQYAHVPEPLELWDVWTSIAGPPVAFEPPSAGFLLDWRSLDKMRRIGIGFATLTLAAGISSTGDAELDRRLPLDEPYRIPPSTVEAIRGARERGRRVVAIGTTVVRALEHAASAGFLRSGEGLANQRLEATSRLQVVDAILTGIHAPDTSHYRLLQAFAEDVTLRRASAEMESLGYREHEFGDSVLIEARKDEMKEARSLSFRAS